MAAIKDQRIGLVIFNAQNASNDDIVTPIGSTKMRMISIVITLILDFRHSKVSVSNRNDVIIDEFSCRPSGGSVRLPLSQRGLGGFHLSITPQAAHSHSNMDSSIFTAPCS